MLRLTLLLLLLTSTKVLAGIKEDIAQSVYKAKSGENSILLPHSMITRQTYLEKGYTEEDLFTLAQNLYHELRRAEAYDVDIAQVGFVVLNRVKSKCYPSNIKDVVWQKNWSKKHKRWVPQFSWSWDGRSDKMYNSKAKARVFKIAQQVLEGTIENRVGKATHYLNKNKSGASWWKKMVFKGKYDEHWFYLEKRCEF